MIFSPRATAMIQTMNERRLIMDGAMGTMLIQSGYTGCTDFAAISRPDIVADIHRQYLQAGADIIETDTFNATSAGLARYGLSDRAKEINRAAARIARREADRYGSRRWVAGSVGPTSHMLSQSDNNAVLRLADDYFGQITALIEGGVDMITIESVCDSRNAITAVRAAAHSMAHTGITLPIMVSVTPAADGYLYSGEPVADITTLLKDLPVLIIGANCGHGPTSVLNAVKDISGAAPHAATSACPNAGLPDSNGRYSLSPQQFAQAFRTILSDSSLRITGGCCGTTPDHIAALALLNGSDTIQGPLPQKM